MEIPEHLVLYDGVCHFCDKTVQFVLKFDADSKFKFAALQSDLGKKILEKYNLDPIKTDSIVYLRKNKLYTQSDAALWIASELKFPTNLLSGLIIFPPPLRNFIYDFIAKNRYRWFGKSESCILPNPKFNNQFLDV